LATGLTGCGGDAVGSSEDNTSSAGGTSGTASSGVNATDSGGTATGSTNGSNSTGTPTNSSTTGNGGTNTNTTAGITGSGGTSSNSSTSTTGTTGAGGAGGAQPDLCQEPLVTGNCNAYFASWGYNTMTGACESFIYGGCGGNDNRFETREACLDTCDPGGLTACHVPGDCTIDLGCCGMSGEANLGNLTAVNWAYSSARSPECALVDCAFQQPEGIEHFGAACSAGHCAVYDVRTDDLSACSEDSDCKLRNGLNCCEGCGESGWVAIAAAQESTLTNPCIEIPCPACEAVEPEGMRAACNAGHCQVVVD
jgi:hypothetical protein